MVARTIKSATAMGGVLLFGKGWAPYTAGARRGCGGERSALGGSDLPAKLKKDPGRRQAKRRGCVLGMPSTGAKRRNLVNGRGRLRLTPRNACARRCRQGSGDSALAPAIASRFCFFGRPKPSLRVPA